MHTVQLLTTLVYEHQFWAYLLILVGLIFEGEIVLISTGIFLHLGALNPFFTLVVVIVGVFGKTFLGYHIGKIIHEKWHETKMLKYIEKRVLTIMPHFNQKPFWSIFASKFIFGVNNMVVIFSGYESIDYKKYLKAEFSATLIWAPLLLGLGYFFSFMALNVSKEIWRFSLIILILMIMFFLFDKLIGWIYEIFEEFYDDVK
jgi:membrane-associated protein